MYKILVIEDEERVRSNVEQILELSDFEPISARNGREGLELALQYHPDLIICDIMMPELDGHSVLTQLKKEKKTAAIPFIFLTAKSAQNDLRQGMNLGADDYLMKPFTPEELLNSVNTRLQKHAALHQQHREQMEELRNNLLQSFPHEFNTPLNGIIGFASLLKADSENVTPDEIREMAESLEYSGHRLHRLVQNYLFYSQLEIIASDPEKIKPLREQKAYCSIAKIVPEVARETASKAGREADLFFDLPEAIVPMGQSYFRRLVQELVDNAFKFSPDNTPVRISAIAKEGRIMAFSIYDRGWGMTAEQISRIGAYMQFERPQHQQKGAGLGLAIAQRLLEFHGGKLKIERKKKTTVVSVLFSYNT
jgi:two-component system sensor histidine kinase/response regulator